MIPMGNKLKNKPVIAKNVQLIRKVFLLQQQKTNWLMVGLEAFLIS